MAKRDCPHQMAVISTHESFAHKGYMCMDCHQFIGDLPREGRKWAIVAFLIPSRRPKAKVKK